LTGHGGKGSFRQQVLGYARRVHERRRVADFWHEVVHEFLDGKFPLRPPLDRWFRAYEGSGEGAVDREALPEPYSGPLLGDARAVFLGLNPGVAIPAYQYRDGIVAQEIREAKHHSDVYKTTPANREPWLSDLGPNRHHLGRISFMRRWNEDESLGDEHMLTFELYPWHSRRVMGPMRPHPDIIQSMVLAPIAETRVRHVFAFGAPWFPVLKGLGLRRIRTLGHGGEPYPTRAASRSVAVFEGPGQVLLVAEKHTGSAGPPSADELEVLRDALAERGLAGVRSGRGGVRRPGVRPPAQQRPEAGTNSVPYASLSAAVRARVPAKVIADTFRVPRAVVEIHRIADGAFGDESSARRRPMARHWMRQFERLPPDIQARYRRVLMHPIVQSVAAVARTWPTQGKGPE
jgi:hypothetical protein